MSRRALDGKYAKHRSLGLIVSTWIGALLSLGLLLFTGNAVKGNFAAMRSCDANNAGLTVVSCGKQGLNITDIFVIGLFVLSAILVVSLFTGAWRMTRRQS